MNFQKSLNHVPSGKLQTASRSKNNLRIFVSAGETSGDQILAKIINGIKIAHPDSEFHGLGGKMCGREGLESLYPLTKTAINGIWDVLIRIFFFLSVLRTLKKKLLRLKPDLVILVDFPGINVRLLKTAMQAGLKIYYICPPQAWAYKKSDLNAFKDIHVQISIQADRKFYVKAGAIVHSGHFFITKKKPGAEKKNSVCVCPGSRGPVIKRNLPLMLNLISRSSNAFLKKSQIIILIPPDFFPYAEKILKFNKNIRSVGIEFCPHTAFSSASAAISFPGSINMELALAGIPYVVVANIDPLTWIAGKILLKTKWTSLPNILFKKEIFPELLTCHGKINQKVFDQAAAQIIKTSFSSQNLNKFLGPAGGFEIAINNCLALLAGAKTRQTYHT